MPAPSVPSELMPSVLTRHEEISPGVYVIGFPRRHDFLPGQAIRLGLDPVAAPRIYSICSGAEENELCVLFNIREGGSLTPRLAKLGRGDRVYASEPYGTFLCPDAEAWWIATGTGIAPFRSMVRRATGATAHERAIRDAYRRGHLRRSYLKGIGFAMGCDGAAAPRFPQAMEARRELEQEAEDATFTVLEVPPPW